MSPPELLPPTVIDAVRHLAVQAARAPYPIDVRSEASLICVKFGEGGCSVEEVAEALLIEAIHAGAALA